MEILQMVLIEFLIIKNFGKENADIETDLKPNHLGSHKIFKYLGS